MRKTLALALAVRRPPAAPARPKVRAITAFIRIDARNYEQQVGEAARFLAGARIAYQAAGFEVQTIRIVTQPLAEYIRGMNHADAVSMVRRFGELVVNAGARPSLGAVMADDDRRVVDVAIDVFAAGDINGGLIVADENGIRWAAAREAARVIKTLAAKSPRGSGNFNFAAAAMIEPYTPFYPAAYHTGPGRVFAVGLESADVVQRVLAGVHEPGAAEKQLAGALSAHLRPAETVALAVAKQTGWTYAGIDFTPAPMGDVSIAAAIESFTGAPFGAGGTLTAAGLITRAVQSAPVRQVGYSGLMVPVLEDIVLARRWAEGACNIDSLLAYSAVCAGGLDTVPLPGDVTEEQFARIVGDVASLAWKRASGPPAPVRPR
jgi:uncharacterized protein